MKNGKSIYKYIMGTVLLVVLSLLIAILLKSYKGYNMKDILFIEGILSLFFGIGASISGDSMGLSLQGLGSSNAQQVNNANLEIDKRAGYDIKTTVSLTFSNIAISANGIIMLLISIIL